MSARSIAELPHQRSFDDLGTPLHDVTFCVIDLETTGGNRNDDMITEIGVVKVLTEVANLRTNFRLAKLLESFKALARDPDRALELVAEYCADVPEGCSNGKVNMALSYVGGSVSESRQTEILDQGWSAAFNVDFNELVQDTLVLNVATGQYQATTWRQFGGIDPVGSRQNLLCRTITDGISLNFARFCSEQRDALILEAQATADLDAQIPLWQAVVQDVHDAYSYIFMRHSPWVIAFNSDVRGVCDRTSPEGTPLRCVLNGRAWFDSTWFVE